MHAVQLSCKLADPHITHRLEISRAAKRARGAQGKYMK